MKSFVYALFFSALSCGSPLSDVTAIRDGKIVIGLHRVAIDDIADAHELLVCAVDHEEYNAAWIEEKCYPAFTSKGNKRVIFTSASKLDFPSNAGQRDKIFVTTTPFVVTGLAFLTSIHKKRGAPDGLAQQVKKFYRKPGFLTAVIGIIAVGTLATSLVCDHCILGAGKRETARYFYDIFAPDTDFIAAQPVRDVSLILNTLAKELELVISRDARRLMQGD